MPPRNSTSASRLVPLQRALQLEMARGLFPFAVAGLLIVAGCDTASEGPEVAQGDHNIVETSPPSPPNSESPPQEPHVPYWDTAEVPEVVPWEETTDTDGPAVVPTHRSVPDSPGVAVEVNKPSKHPENRAFPAPRISPPVAEAAVPVDPAPGSSPGRPNPFGFPAGYSPQNTAPPSPGPQAQPSGAPAAVPQVRLSNARALAQSLPTGTAMGFSLDYRFVTAHHPQGRYGWIIQPPRGNAVAMPVTLQSQGTLSHFVTQWGAVTGTYKLQLIYLDAANQPHPMSRAIDAVYAY